MHSDQPALLVADSFRVRVHGRAEEAQARRWLDHRLRFQTSAAEHLPAAEVDVWIDEAAKRIAHYGAGFPRLEVWRRDGSPVLAVSLRPLPQLGEHIELRSIAEPVRLDPETKGPDIDLLAATNRRLGSEALLISDGGAVVEGATTAIVWWEENTLCAAPPHGRIASVTERQVLDAAAEYGYSTAPERTIDANRLRHVESWALNALHGIRVVTRVDGRETGGPDRTRLAEFCRALDQSWQTIT